MTDVSKRPARVNSTKAAHEWLDANPDTYLFPIRPLAKTPPLIPDNLNRASNDRAQIDAWAKKFPGCNWGCSLPKSNRIVVDVDRKLGKRGQLTHDILDLWYGWPPTMEVLSPSGGYHLHYKGKHLFALGKRGFGEDVDSPNYTLIPGCRLKNGGVYKYSATDFGVPNVSAAPAWFYEVLGKPHEVAQRKATAVVDLDQEHNVQWGISYVHDDAPPAIEGQNGDMTTVHVAMVLRDHGISEQTAYEIMAEHYNTDDKCIPIWTDDDLRTKVRNAYAYATNAPGAGTAEHDFAEPYRGTIPEYKRPSKAEQRQQRGRKAQRRRARQMT